jgi:GTPase
VRAHRARHRQQRQQAGIPVVTIVGYTNAGKSTLLNTLTQANVLAADQLFATLDPTTRRVALPGGSEVLLNDTVGFIQKLPTHLVAAFRATLEEITESDLILHVVDITHPNVAAQAATVAETLQDLGVSNVPILVALNKIDLLDESDEMGEQLAQYPNSLAISASTGQGLDLLLARIEGVLQSARPLVSLLIPYSRGDMLSLLHERATVQRQTYEAEGTYLEARVPEQLWGTVQPYRTKSK